jgi:CheY-like chemotaxis protein
MPKDFIRFRILTTKINRVTLLRNLLQRDGGFNITQASSGEEALELSRNLCGRIGILITDIDIEGMSGIELYTRIREERPETAVLFISANVDCILQSLPECRYWKNLPCQAVRGKGGGSADHAMRFAEREVPT